MEGHPENSWILEHRSLACVGSDPVVSPLSSHPVQNEELCDYCAVENSPLRGRVLLSLADFVWEIGLRLQVLSLLVKLHHTLLSRGQKGKQGVFLTSFSKLGAGELSAWPATVVIIQGRTVLRIIGR